MRKILKWQPDSEKHPETPGRYLVTLRRPSAGHYVQIRQWTGVTWGQGSEVVAWMEMPDGYKGVGYAGPK